MEIRKERNVLVAYENDEKLGGFVITDGSWIGKSGKPVKGVPSCFTYAKLEEITTYYRHTPTINERAYAEAIKFYRRQIADYAYQMERYLDHQATRLEQLLSLGLRFANRCVLDEDLELTKDVVEYLKEHNHGIYSREAVKRFKDSKKYASLRNDPNMPEWTERILERLLDADLPVSFLRSAFKRCEQEKLYWACENRLVGDIARIIIDYYKKAHAMFGEVKVERNFLSHYIELCALKEEYDRAHYDEGLARHNNLPALYYEDDIVTIRPLLTRAAFHDEGEQQRNCVERLYMSKVRDGETHVVQVRRKDNPEKSFITCEVTNDGHIKQWLAFCNDRPSAEWNGLRSAYQAHLEKNWK